MTNIPPGVAPANDATAQSAVYPSLAGKRVVITGGGSGIGAALVEAFARQGAETIFVDILERESSDLVSRLADAPFKTRFHRLDLTDLSAMEAFFKSLGGIDVLINNAGNDDRHELKGPP
jgi:D-xylose 1-dehydrogenase